jgi:hypothetical protein
LKWINAHGHFKLSGFGEYYQYECGSSQNIKYIFLYFRQAQGKLGIVGRGSFKIENIYFFVSDKLKEDWRLLGGMSQNIKYLFHCFRQAQGRLEIVGRGCLKI